MSSYRLDQLKKEIKKVTRDVLGMHSYAAFNGELRQEDVVNEVIILMPAVEWKTNTFLLSTIYEAITEYGPVGVDDKEWFNMPTPKPSRINSTAYRVGER